MKLKLIAVLIAITGVFMAAVLWRTDRFVYGDRLSWVESQARAQTAAIKQALAIELQSLPKVMSLMAGQKSSLNWTSMTPYFAAAQLSYSGNEWKVQSLMAREGSKAASWREDFVNSALGSMPADGAKLSYFVKPFQDTQRGRYVAVVLREGDRAFALFSQGEAFQALVDAQKGTLGSVSIVTEGGLTVGHSIPEYLGTVMKDDPVFKQAKKGEASKGGEVFELATGEQLYGLFEEVPRSNLLVLHSAPMSEVLKGRAGLLWQVLFWGLGLVLVGLAGVLWVIAPVEERMESLEQSLAVEQSKGLSEEKVAESASAADAQKIKVEASTRVASALAHEMRGPLASILGHSQMILSRSPDDDVTKSVDSILRETRSARDVLDKLLGYAGENVGEKNEMKIEGPLAKALKPLEPLFQQKGIKVVKNFKETSSIPLHVDALTKAFTNILMNSVEAMERMPKKELQIDLFESEDGIHLNLVDTGEGIEADKLAKIFDPFFTTRSFMNHMGLGLSLAYGILQEHQAGVNVESQRGQGTKVSMVFKKQMSEATVLRAPAAVKEEEIVIQEVPQLKEESPEVAEAKAQFQAEQEATELSPLDVNIDKLLEFPEEEAQQEATVVVPVKKQSSASPSEFEFIDGFLGDEDATRVQASSAAQTVSGAGEEKANLMAADEDFGQFIVPPKKQAQKKVSKLDDFEVEIRRPGKRI